MSEWIGGIRILKIKDTVDIWSIEECASDFDILWQFQLPTTINRSASPIIGKICKVSPFSAAVKDIEINPVRARLVADPYAWPRSSARAHAEGNDDLLVKVAPLLELVGDWKLFLSDPDEEEANRIRGHERRDGQWERTPFSTCW
jgi:hypothetical protein